MVRLILLSAVLSLVSSACATVTQKLSTQRFYRRDMKIDALGNTGDGYLVLPKAVTYDFKFTSKARMDLFTLQSCHREWVLYKEGGGWFGRGNKEVSYEYEPQDGIENIGACPLILGGYDKESGLHSWGFVDFEDESTNMPVLLNCNGKQVKYGGVSICQARVGLSQMIRFEEEVIVKPDPECDGFDHHSGFIFELIVKPEECVYAFKGIKTNNVHRMTVLGYQDIVIRKED